MKSNQSLKDYVCSISAISVCPGKAICGRRVSLSEPVSTSIFCLSKPVTGSNVCSRKTVSVSFVCSVKSVYGAVFVQVNPFELLMFVQVNPHVPVSESVSVNNVRPSEPISRTHTPLWSSIVCAINIRPSKTASASNIDSGKPVYTNNVRPSRSTCGGQVCQSKPNSDGNIRLRDLISTQVMSSQVNLFVQTIFASLVHHCQLNR